MKCKRRNELPGSHGGRFIFGTSEQRAAAAGAQVLQLKGIESARAKFSAWGEEWAEEEDLPTVFNDSCADMSQKSLNKIQRQAESRINKLKIEKRNTKYKGVI